MGRISRICQNILSSLWWVRAECFRPLAALRKTNWLHYQLSNVNLLFVIIRWRVFELSLNWLCCTARRSWTMIWIFMAVINVHVCGGTADSTRPDTVGFSGIRSKTCSLCMCLNNPSQPWTMRPGWSVHLIGIPHILNGWAQEGRGLEVMYPHWRGERLQNLQPEEEEDCVCIHQTPS